MRFSFAALILSLAAFGASPPSTAPTGMILIPAGTFAMGTEDGFPYEAPVHQVTLRAFYLDKNPVTVAEFEKFIQATGYKTDAEKFGWSGVFDPAAKSWTKVDGATWRHPDGPQSTP